MQPIGALAVANLSNVPEEKLIEEVVVTGIRPGPPLWKVKHKDHVLWVFGTVTPIPKRMEWDSEAVEYIISQAQSYVAPPQIYASVTNPFKAIGLVRRYTKAKKLPNKQTLEQVLSPELNAEFERLRAEYAPRNSAIRKLRPSFAAEKLMQEATDAIGLSDDAERIEKKLAKLVRRHDVPVTESVIEAPAVDFLAVLEDLLLNTEARCLAATLQSIEKDLNAAARRANAWANGSALALRALDYPDVEVSCTQVIFERPEAAELQREIEGLWLRSAETALRSHAQTFAVLPMRDINHPDGLLARLQARGYEVTTPVN